MRAVDLPGNPFYRHLELKNRKSYHIGSVQSMEIQKSENIHFSNVSDREIPNNKNKIFPNFLYLQWTSDME